jgi:hypothetical protein
MTTHKLARIAGLLYLLIFPTAGPAIVGFQSMLAGSGGLLERLEANRMSLELGIVLGAAGAVVWLVAALAFHELMRPVSHRAARLLVAFASAGALLLLAALARRMDVLSLLDGSTSIPGLSGEALLIHAELTVRSTQHLIDASIIFWGLWLLPLGWMVFRCDFMPRVIGVLLMLGAPFYVAIFVGHVLDPNYDQTLFAQIVGYAFGIPGMIGEFATMLWLLIWGTRRRTRAEPSPAPA